MTTITLQVAKLTRSILSDARMTHNTSMRSFLDRCIIARGRQYRGRQKDYAAIVVGMRA